MICDPASIRPAGHALSFIRLLFVHHLTKRLLHAIDGQRAWDGELSIQQEVRNTVDVVPRRFPFIQANVHGKFICGQQRTDFILIHAFFTGNAKKYIVIRQFQALRKISMIETF